MSYLFRGQDRRDLKKTILGLQKLLARDAMAVNPKKTTAISTRVTVFDTTATFPGYQAGQANYVLSILEMQVALRRGTQAVLEAGLGGGGSIGSIAVISGGSYPNLANGTYPVTIVDDGPGKNATATATVTNGVVVSVVVNTAGTGYVLPVCNLLGAG